MLRSMLLNHDEFPASNLRSLERRWIPPDAEFAEQMRFRREMYQKRGKIVFGVAPGFEKRARAASQELLDDLVQTLVTHHPDFYRLDGTRITDLKTGFELDLADPKMHPLVKAGLLSQDDLTVSMPDGKGTYRMVAAFAATPSGWKVHDFLGLSIHEIHQHIANYQGKLKLLLERIMPNLKVGKDSFRNNWFLELNHDLAMPRGRRDPSYATGFTKDNVGQRLVLRSEIETLFRLPIQKAMIFTIRPRVWRLDDVKRDAPDIAWRIGQGLGQEGSEYTQREWAPAARRLLADVPPPAEPTPADLRVLRKGSGQAPGSATPETAAAKPAPAPASEPAPASSEPAPPPPAATP